MKKIFTAILFFYSSLLFAGIGDINGPATICPGEETKFTVSYQFFNHPTLPYPSEVVREITWKFIQNGVVIKTLQSKDYPRKTFQPSEAEIIINDVTVFGVRNVVNLAPGNFTVKVEISTVLLINPAFPPTSPTYPKSKTFTAGIVLGSLGSITGASNICPNSFSTYSVPKLWNATSYTWEVPSGWMVNGISGPVVTGQSNSVSITSPNCYNSQVRTGENPALICSPHSVVIKVKGINSTCGNDESSYRSKTIYYDYPFSISHTETSDSTVTFYTSPSGFPVYIWQFPDEWTAAYNTNHAVEVNHNDEGGTAHLTVKTYCNYYYSKSYFFAPLKCDKPTSVFPNPTTNELMLAPSPCDIEISSVAIEENGMFRKVEANKNDGVYKIDVSALKPGLHILKTKNSKGEEQFIRFLKSK